MRGHLLHWQPKQLRKTAQLWTSCVRWRSSRWEQATSSVGLPSCKLSWTFTCACHQTCGFNDENSSRLWGHLITLRGNAALQSPPILAAAAAAVATVAVTGYCPSKRAWPCLKPTGMLKLHASVKTPTVLPGVGGPHGTPNPQPRAVAAALQRKQWRTRQLKRKSLACRPRPRPRPRPRRKRKEFAKPPKHSAQQQLRLHAAAQSNKPRRQQQKPELQQ